MVGFIVTLACLALAAVAGWIAGGRDDIWFSGLWSCGDDDD